MMMSPVWLSPSESVKSSSSRSMRYSPKCGERMAHTLGGTLYVGYGSRGEWRVDDNLPTAGNRPYRLGKARCASHQRHTIHHLRYYGVQRPKVCSGRGECSSKGGHRGTHTQSVWASLLQICDAVRADVEHRKAIDDAGVVTHRNEWRSGVVATQVEYGLVERLGHNA